MLNNLTLYTGLGLIGSLALFMLLFSKWKLPEFCRKVFLINSRTKAILFIIALGFITSFGLSFLFMALALAPMIHQLIEGAVMGFNCALLVGIMRPSNAHKHKSAEEVKRTGKRQYEENRGRRSKG